MGDAIKDAFGKIKDSFNNIKDKLLDGVKSFLGMKNKKPEKDYEKNRRGRKNEQKSSVSDVKKTLSGKSDEFNKTLDTMKKEGTGIDIVGSENSNLTEQVQLTVTKENNEKPTNLKIDESSGGSSGGSEKIESSTKSGGTSGSTVNSSVTKSGDALNISKPKKTVSTTTITPERKSKNTVMIVGNKGGQSQSQGGMGSKSGTKIIVQKDNSIKDQFALSLF